MQSQPRIDSHQHFWRLSRGDYGWLTPALGPIHRDFEPADLAPHLTEHDIAATILVQAAPDDVAGRPEFAVGQHQQGTAVSDSTQTVSPASRMSWERAWSGAASEYSAR